MGNYLYITTPIFYPNDSLHIGHAYTIVLADIISRYKASKGYSVFLQTGSDEHGEKIEKKANFLEISPQELVEKNIILFKKLFERLDILDHIFYRTSSFLHKERTQKIFIELLNKGDVYLGKYEGKYCVVCEDYISDSKVFKKNFCPNSDCNYKLREIKEEAYFFRASKYYSKLIKHFSQNTEFLLPLNLKNQLFESFLKQENIRDLCITRSDIK